MNNIENSKQLKLEILRLEALAFQQEGIIKQDFEIIQEQYSPSNLIKNALSGFVEKNEKDGSFLGSSLSFLINFLSRKTIFKNSKGIMGILLSYGFEALVSKIVSSKSGMIKDLISNLFKRKEKQEEEEEDSPLTSK